MKLFSKKLVALFLFSVTLSANNTAIAHGGVEFTYYPGNMCKAAVAAQDENFRTFNNRHKNTSNRSTYVVCPIPSNLDTGTDGSQGEDINVNLFFLNEGSVPVTFSCALYGFGANLENRMAPSWFSSDQITMSPDKFGLARTDAISFAGLPTRPPNVYYVYNAVCLIPPQVSISGYNIIQIP